MICLLINGGKTMKGNIGKGTEFFKFMGDYYKLLGDFWIIESSESYWEQIKDATEELLAKYKYCDFYMLARGMILLFLIYMDEAKLHQKKLGRWSITIRGD